MAMTEEQYDFNVEFTYDPLTSWSNEPLVQDLKGDLQEALPDHNLHESEVKEWLDYLHVRNGAAHKKVEGRSSVTPKLIRKQAEWRYAALSEPFLSQENIFSTSPRSWEDKDAAIQSGYVLNYQWNTQIDKVTYIDDMVRTAVDEGTVIIRVGWEFDEEEVTVPKYSEREANPMLAQAIMMTIAQLQQDPSIMDQLPDETRMDVEATLRNQFPTDVYRDGNEKIMRTIKNHPTAEVCEYDSVIIDPSCKGDLEKAQFVVYRFETSLSDLESSPVNYKNLDQINFEDASITRAEDVNSSRHVSNFNFKDKARRKVYAYEYWGYWDIDNSGVTVPIVATWIGDTMVRLEKSPFPEIGLPFVAIPYLPRRKHIYGEPDGALLKENQQIAGAVTRGMLDTMGRSAVAQKGYRKGALDVTNQRRFERGEDYTFNNNVMDPRTTFYMHEYPELPASAPFMLELQNQEAEALTGVKAFHGGISGEGLGRSATAARGALDAASKREIGIVRRLANGMIKVARKHMALNALFLDDEEVVRITNGDFVTIKRDDLQGSYDIKMDISTAETDQAKAEELSFMLQTMGQSLPFELTQVVMADIARLRKMPDLEKKLLDYQPQPDPHQQRMQELEAQKLMAEIRKLESETIENLAEAEKDSADAELSKSKRDNEDLAFMENESGVTQERDLQKMREQARAQGEMKILESQLNNQQPTNPDGDSPAF